MFIYLYTVAPGLQTAREMRDMKGIAETYDERKDEYTEQPGVSTRQDSSQPPSLR